MLRRAAPSRARPPALNPGALAWHGGGLGNGRRCASQSSTKAWNRSASASASVWPLGPATSAAKSTTTKTPAVAPRGTESTPLFPSRPGQLTHPVRASCSIALVTATAAGVTRSRARARPAVPRPRPPAALDPAAMAVTAAASAASSSPPPLACTSQRPVVDRVVESLSGIGRAAATHATSLVCSLCFAPSRVWLHSMLPRRGSSLRDGWVYLYSCRTRPDAVDATSSRR